MKNWISNSRNFLNEVVLELKKVTWPAKREVYGTTLVVIVTVIVFGLYLYILDLGLNRLVKAVFAYFA
ncbi:MAG TPA: preprotein translocase subunit SecE [Acidobacteriota bacterium]|jgi:preprotein translocase subunit SecE